MRLLSYGSTSSYTRYYMEIDSSLQAQATLCPWGINRPDILCVLCHRPFYVRGAITSHEDECNYGGRIPLLLKHGATWRSVGISRPGPFYVRGPLMGPKSFSSVGGSQIEHRSLCPSLYFSCFVE
jgi:hypothetical protein